MMAAVALAQRSPWGLLMPHQLILYDFAGHRLTFVQFVQAPHFNHPAAVYGAFDFSGPLDFVCNAAGLCDKVKEAQ
jgi:4-hydroxyphenylacetate 3-monooxygenase